MKSANEIAQEFLKKGDAVGWFEILYQSAGGDASKIPWADLKPNPNLTSWLARPRTIGPRALVVGCGLGDDAEELAGRGLEVTAFDVSPAAIEWCRKRFPRSGVRYEVADLFGAEYQSDFVFESYTIQALPVLLRRKAMECIARFVAPQGRMLVITRGRDSSDDPGSLPWPLTRQELAGFQELGLREISFEDYRDDDERRFRVEYQRAKA